MDIALLIKQGEGQTLEFKKSLSEQREGLESLCAMLNADSGTGTIIFGVASGGVPCGVEAGNLDTAQCTISQAVSQKFQPPIQVEITTPQYEGKQLILLSAKRLPDVAYHEYDGRAWIRQGSNTRQLTLAEKDSLRRSRNLASHPGPWKCDRCGSWVVQLISVTMTAHGPKRNYDCDCGGQFRPVLDGGSNVAEDFKLSACGQEIPECAASKAIPTIRVAGSRARKIFTVEFSLQNNSLGISPQVTHIYIWLSPESAIWPCYLKPAHPIYGVDALGMRHLRGEHDASWERVRTVNAPMASSPDGLAFQCRVDASIPPLPYGALETFTMHFMLCSKEAKQPSAAFKLRIHTPGHYYDFPFQLTLKDDVAVGAVPGT